MSTTAAAAVLDVDGTLLDTAYLHTVAWWEALRQHGHPAPMARIHRAVGLPPDRLLEQVLGPHRDTGADPRITTAHQALYDRHRPALRPFDGGPRLLAECAARGWTVVLTAPAGHEPAELRRLLGAAPSVTVVPGTAGSDPVRAALALAGGAADHAVFVGATVWTVRTAVGCGVPCVAVETGGIPAADLRDAGATEVHPDIATLLAHLDDSLLSRPRTWGAALR
ncbi:HAD family hydrolase [Kitasatospora camelliae]|uniref:HAD family hydrolase n=1 Tax=Kitasatospora camelliae TaxID=3156397 RepID=A0AAU8JTV1_9ACTN